MTPTSLVLDAGALVAVELRDRRLGALLRVAQRERLAVRTSAAVVAQVWRSGSRQAHLARLLSGVEVTSLDPAAGRAIGALLARSGTADVVDGHVAVLTRSGDTVLTGDVPDIHRLLDVLGVRASIWQT